MRAIQLSLVAAALLAGVPALAQDRVDSDKLTGEMAGRELRLHDGDSVVGTIQRVVGRADGRADVVVELEETGKSVAIDLEQVERQNGKYYVGLEPAQLAELPESPSDGGEAPSQSLPYGGVTPGWGGSPAPTEPQR